MDYPDVPDLPGVPALLRVPAAAFGLVSQGLSATSGIMNSVALIAHANPAAILTTIAPQIGDAVSLIGGVSSTISRYANSALSRFAPSVDIISAGLSSIQDSILNSPSDSLDSITDTIDSTALQTDATSEAFDASQEVTTVDGVETVTVTAYRGGPQWGIFKDGKSVIKADNVLSFEYKRDWTISDYPIEEGGFESYDKVQLPFDARVRFSAGGSLDTRQALIDSIEAIAGDLLLYDVVTPEKTYQSVNVVHYDLHRKSDDGVGLLKIDVYLEEVRNTAQAAFSTAAAAPADNASKTPAPKSPTAAPQKNNGTVQPKQVLPDPIAGVGIL